MNPLRNTTEDAPIAVALPEIALSKVTLRLIISTVWIGGSVQILAPADVYKSIIIPSAPAQRAEAQALIGNIMERTACEVPKLEADVIAAPEASKKYEVVFNAVVVAVSLKSVG